MHTCINLTVTCMFALLFCENVYVYYIFILTITFWGSQINFLFFFYSLIRFFATQNYNTSEIKMMWPVCTVVVLDIIYI